MRHWRFIYQHSIAWCAFDQSDLELLDGDAGASHHRFRGIDSLLKKMDFAAWTVVLHISGHVFVGVYMICIYIYINMSCTYTHTATYLYKSCTHEHSPAFDINSFGMIVGIVMRIVISAIESRNQCFLMNHEILWWSSEIARWKLTIC